MIRAMNGHMTGMTGYIKGSAQLLEQIRDSTRNSQHAMQRLFHAISQSQSSLDHILKTMHQSDFFSRYEDNPEGQFWIEYERVAKQTDEEFLERYNSDLDVQLIFVCIVDLGSLLLEIHPLLHTGWSFLGCQFCIYCSNGSESST